MSTTEHTRTPEVRLVPLGEIQIADGGNPRRRFDEQALSELAASIGQHGVLQPLVVSTHDGGYTLIAGERRYRAAKLAGLTQVPVSVRAGDEQAIELAVDENLHRQDLDPVEQAHGFQTILQSGRLSKKALAVSFASTRCWRSCRRCCFSASTASSAAAGCWRSASR